MKRVKKIICIVLLLATAAMMFLPLAEIYDDMAAVQKKKVENAEGDLRNTRDKLERDSVVYDQVYPIIIDSTLNNEQKAELYDDLDAQAEATGGKKLPADLKEFLTGDLTWEKIVGLSTKQIDEKKKLLVLNGDPDSADEADQAPIIEGFTFDKKDFKEKEGSERLAEVLAAIENLDETQVIHLRDRAVTLYYDIKKTKGKIAEKEEILKEQQDILASMGDLPAEKLATVSFLPGQLPVSAKQNSLNEDAKDIELNTLQIDTDVVNKSNGYPADGNLQSYHTLIWVAFALLIAAALLMLAAGTKVGDKMMSGIAAKQKAFKVIAAACVFLSLFLIATTDFKSEAASTNQVLILIMVVASAVLLCVSYIGKSKRLYTIAAFMNLGAILLLAYSVLRLQALPLRRFVEAVDEAGAVTGIKAAPAVTRMNLLVMIPLLLFPVVALAMHIQNVHNTKRSMIYVFCTLLSALAILPFWIMIVNGTRSSQAIQQGVSLVPSSYLNYNMKVLNAVGFSVDVGFRNSAIIAFGSTILSVYFSAMTAYGFKVYQFKGRGFLYAVVMAIIMIPGQVTGTGFFIFMNQLGWVDSFWPLIIPAIAAASTVFFFRQYLEANLQLSLVEAARIDGSNEFRTFNRIILPIMVPAMATMGIMSVIGSWNNYLTPLMLLRSKDKFTLPMFVKMLRGDIFKVEYGSIYLGLTLTALPLIIVYFALSKYIIAGVALGGVKE